MANIVHSFFLDKQLITLYIQKELKFLILPFMGIGLGRRR